MADVLNFPARGSQLGDNWEPIRQSPGIDWHRHERADCYSLRACIVIWIVGAALGWAVAAGAVWGVLDAIARAGS